MQALGACVRQPACRSQAHRAKPRLAGQSPPRTAPRTAPGQPGRGLQGIKQFFDVAVKGAWSQRGKALSKVTEALGLEPRKVPGEKYDVQAYPLQAIEEFKRQIETDPDFLKKYRIGEA